MKRVTKKTKNPTKVWVGANEIIERNSQEETYNELNKDGYPAKLSAFIKNRDKLLAEETKLRNAKKPELAKKKSNAEPEMGM